MIDSINITNTVLQIDSVFRDTIPVLITNQQIKTIWDIIKDNSSIITLILGVLLGFGVDKLKNILTFRKTRRYFFFSLNELSKSIEGQLEVYSGHIKLYEKEDNYIPAIPYLMGFSTKSINVVPHVDIFKIFVIDCKDKIRIPMILNGLSMIDKINVSRYKENDEINRIYERTVKRFGENFDVFLSQLYNLINDENNFNINSPIKNFSTEIKNEVIKFESTRTPNEDTSIIKIINTFVTQINKIFLKYNSPVTTSHIFQVYNAFFEFKDNREKIGNIFVTDYKNLISIKKNFDQIIEDYKRYLKD